MRQRKPETPNPDAETHSTEDIPTGRRFIAEDSERWRIEQELVAEGADLANRAVPVRYRDLSDPAAIREAIAAEAEADRPNQQSIGYLNERLAEVAES